MTEQLTPYVPQEQVREKNTLSDWETVQIGNEEFTVKKNRVFPTEYEGKDVIFNINEYHHKETGTQITVWSLGLNRDVKESAIVRLDYGCPCMSLGGKFLSHNHDCEQQRTTAFQTIAEKGIGAIAIVSEQTAAGNGHGAPVVFDQSTAQYMARQNGEPVPSMEQYYINEGYFPFDARKHNLTALALADTVGLERPVIPGMSSKNKNQQLIDAGVNVLPGVRAEFVTDHVGSNEGLRRSTHHNGQSSLEPGAYLVFDLGNSRESYLRISPNSQNESSGQASTRRSRARSHRLKN